MRRKREGGKREKSARKWLNIRPSDPLVSCKTYQIMLLKPLRLRRQLDGRIVTSRKYALEKNHQVVRAAAILRNKWERDRFVQKLPENDSPDTSPGESQYTITTNPKRVVFKIFIVL